MKKWLSLLLALVLLLGVLTQAAYAAQPVEYKTLPPEEAMSIR